MLTQTFKFGRIMPEQSMSPDFIRIIAAVLRHFETDGLIRPAQVSSERFGIAKGTKDKDSFCQVHWNISLYFCKPCFLSVEVDEQHYKSVGVLSHLIGMISLKTVQDFVPATC